MDFLNKIKPRNEKKNPITVMSLTVVIMYLISGMLLLMLALLLYQMELTEEVVKIGIIVVYIASGFVGGFFAGKQMKDKRYLWGLLAGAMYYILLFLFSILMTQGMGEEMMLEPMRMLTTLFLCSISGMAGGMLS